MKKIYLILIIGMLLISGIFAAVSIQQFNSREDARSYWTNYTNTRNSMTRTYVTVALNTLDNETQTICEINIVGEEWCTRIISYDYGRETINKTVGLRVEWNQTEEYDYIKQIVIGDILERYELENPPERITYTKN